jgi:hypothetical protein
VREEHHRVREERGHLWVLQVRAWVRREKEPDHREQVKPERVGVRGKLKRELDPVLVVWEAVQQVLVPPWVDSPSGWALVPGRPLEQRGQPVKVPMEARVWVAAGQQGQVQGKRHREKA